MADFHQGGPITTLHRIIDQLFSGGTVPEGVV